MQLAELVKVLDTYLEPWRFKDYGPNGLQVEGHSEVRSVVAGVTASQGLIDVAIERGADAILVHHGYFWKNENPCITGMKKARLSRLLAHDISLIAYHLPLDAHPVVGNNARLAAVLGLAVDGQAGDQGLLWHGHLEAPLPARGLAESVAIALGRPPLLLGPADRLVRRVAWCTGGAQGFFEEAIALGVDAYITGEVSEQHHHIAEELGVAFLAAGHHATERYGVAALAGWLTREHGLETCFVDLPNPV